MCLAARAGVNIPDIRLRNITGKDVFFIKRFDRVGFNVRMPYISALTMLGISEYDHAGFSYPNLAGKVRQHGRASDLEQLFRRIAVNIIVRNTDDHPRNHGFLLKDRQWTLTPAFDITPTASTKGISSIPRLAMSLGRMGNEGSLDNLLSQTGEFGLNMDEGREIFNQCAYAISTGWREIFDQFNVSDEDAAKFNDTFSVYMQDGDKNGKKKQSYRWPAP